MRDLSCFVSVSEWRETVGIQRIGGLLTAALPRVYKEVEAELRKNEQFRTKHLLLLIRSLARYARSMSENPDVKQVLAIENPSDLDWLDAAAQLYEEYQRNGLYWAKASVDSSRHAAGSINWQRTISKHNPIMVEDSPLYFDLVRKVRRRSGDDLLHRLHTSIIEEITLTFTGRTDRTPGYQLSQGEFDALRLNPDLYLRSLSRKTFSDRGRRLIDLMGRYLRSSSSASASSRDGGVFCRTEAYEYVWEEMLRQVLENRRGRASRSLVRGEWKNEAGTSAGIGPRIDLAFWSEDGLAIFDAKDKELQSGRRTGSEQDHYKQAIYAKLASPTPVACNALLFPKLAGSSALFDKLGSHEWPGVSFSLVHEIGVNYAAVSNAYIAGRTLNVLPLVEGLARSNKST